MNDLRATFSFIVRDIRTRTIGGLPQAIKEVDWTLVGEDTGQTFELPGTTTLADPEPEDFTPLASVTPVQVVEWIEANEPDGRLLSIKQHIQMVLDREIAKASLVSTPLPWAPPPVAEEATEPAAQA